jgi:hypothetical protein
MSKVPTLLEPGKLMAVGVEPGETGLAYVQRWLRRRWSKFGWNGAAMEDRVLFILAETGAGKSTVLPVGIFRILRGASEPPTVRYRGQNVVCTQPRVLTAQALARDVSSGPNRDMVMGKTVGYQTGPVSNSPPAGLVYVTSGVLAAQLASLEDSEIMDMYFCIIVDEVHERSLDADLTLMVLRDFYLRNAGDKRLPFLLLTSATFDPARYAEYFGVGLANIVLVRGRQFDIHDHWPSTGTNDYCAEAAATAVRIHEDNLEDPPERGDILVFIPGHTETRQVVEALNKVNERYLKEAGAPPPLLILRANREVVESQGEEFENIFERVSKLPLVGERQIGRRVVVATSVAETGLTINTLRYVVDSGWARSRELYPPWGAGGLLTRPAPQNRLKQRRGRAGRLFDGDYYPLFTESVHAALDAMQAPDIVTMGPSDIYLRLAWAQQRQKLRTERSAEFRVEDIALIDAPPVEALLSTHAAAVELGFVSAHAALPSTWPPDPLVDLPTEKTASAGWGLTGLGQIAAAFTRTTMEGARVLLAGYTWGVSASDLATAVAAFGMKPGGLLAKIKKKPEQVLYSGLPLGAAALRAALPLSLAQKTGGGERTKALPPTEEEAFYFRMRLLLADDYAEVVLIFDAFMRRLEASHGDLPAVFAWCDEIGLSFDSLVELTRKREAIQEEMILAGLDPFRLPERRLYSLSIEEFTKGLIGFKRCLYDGLRCRLLRREGAKYLSKQGLHVRTPALLTDAMFDKLRALHVTLASGPSAKPHWIITDQFRLAPVKATEKEKQAPLLYTVETGLVSVLDGYLSPDPDFDDPVTFRDGAVESAPQEVPLLDEAEHGRSSLDAYDRACRASLYAEAGPPLVPVLQLDDQQLAALFVPQQLENMIERPLKLTCPCTNSGPT